MCSASWQSLSAKEERPHKAQATKSSHQNGRRYSKCKVPQLQTLPAAPSSSPSSGASLLNCGTKKSSNRAPSQAAYILGSSNFLSGLFGTEQTLVCPRWVGALMKNKAIQTRMTVHTTHPRTPVTRGRGSAARKGLLGPGAPTATAGQAPRQVRR